MILPNLLLGREVPFLAWFALGATSLQRCLGVVALTGLVELSFLITTHGQVRGPDGRSWNTKGVPSWQGSLILQAWVQQRVKEQSQQSPGVIRGCW